MDQAIKSALNKYLGKNGGQQRREVSSVTGVLFRVLLIGMIVCTLLYCGVRFNILGLGETWEKVSSMTVGEQTVGQVLENIKEKTDDFLKVEYEGPTAAPENPNGESGRAEVGQNDEQAEE